MFWIDDDVERRKEESGEPDGGQKVRADVARDEER